MIYADASFLVALFVAGDDHWHEAWHWWRQNHGLVVAVSRLTIFEAENTIRGLAVAKKCSSSEVQKALEGIRRGYLEGVLQRRSVPEHRLFPQAARLSQHHSETSAYGALDILHVAMAQQLRAATLLSFDHRQRELAKLEGLRTQP